jgi:hypothetical protein
MLPLTITERRRKNGGGGSVIKPACLFASLVPATLLCFGALSLLLAHKSLGGGSIGTGTGMIPENIVWSSIFPEGSGTSNNHRNGGVGGNPNQQARSGSDAGGFFTQYPPDVYEEAWYLDDEPDYETPQRIYEDSRVIELLANNSYVPFNVFRGPNGTSVLQGAAEVHKVLTALRDVSNIQEFFNPVCFKYRFPNISLFPTMSIIVPMQNGKKRM